LALEITAPYSSPKKKADALQNYFLDFPYTLKMDPTPDGEDFVDYFLFNQREGYCVYFASAMAIMARAAGLPSRYVVGYRHSGEPRPGNPNAYIIRQKNAHAWTEVFISGFGWTRFEPTPSGYADVVERELNAPDAENNLEETQELEESEELEEIEEIEEIEEQKTPRPTENPESDANKDNTENQDNAQKKKFELKPEQIKGAALLALFVSFCFMARKIFKILEDRIKLGAKDWNREMMIKA
jgi:transglutaminase-like putative cysteine protease